jgi:hypothetical protein
MNFSIHIDDQVAAALEKEAKRSGKTRNRLIGEAVRAYLERTRPTEWPPELLDFAPVKGLKPFESFRRKGKVRARFP